MATIKELSKKKEIISGGHRACAGCIPMIAMRQVLRAASNPVVVGCATGCMEVVTTIYPYTAWRSSYIHNAFENVAATISGVETAYRILKKKGKIPEDTKIDFIAFGGDGGTYDIGIQSLSGAMERGHNMLYVCYNNEAYMNTGVQRSSATPYGAFTNTAPSGSVSFGKKQFSKDLTGIMAAHRIPYVAQTSVSHWRDLVNKVQKALSIDGPTFLNILAPCQLGWRFPPEKGVEIARLAVETCFWPLYEVENGKLRITIKPKEKKPVLEYIKLQGRFRHLMKDSAKDVVDKIQKEIDLRWEELLEKSKV
ncbi:pyruvate ferredoxin oxidoreductase [candidate division KSB1 bacterium]|nr:MAG: pyruvate ferredoxin oxidoreductase [candidate division KSB1 bacterium]